MRPAQVALFRVFALAAICLSLGCFSSARFGDALSEPLAASSAGQVLTFRVQRADTFEGIADVEVHILDRNGSLKIIGRTDEFGRVDVAKKRLVNSKAVIFCKDYFFCGAFISDRSNLMIYRERKIHLAPFYT